MGHFAKSRTLRTSAVAGLAIALASPFARSADALPGAGGDATAPGFTLSVVHQFPVALQLPVPHPPRHRGGRERVRHF